MQKLMKCLRSVALCVVVFGITRPAVAQETPKAEVSGGYQLLNLSTEEELISLSLSKGWYLDVAGSINRVISLVGEVGGAYKSQSETSFGFTEKVDLNLHEFMAGVRLSARQRPQAAPFGHVLVGGVRVGATVTSSGPRFNNTQSISETDFAVQTGGGVNVLMTRTMGFRIGADYLRIFPKNEGASGPAGINVFRFAVGLVLSFPTK